LVSITPTNSGPTQPVALQAASGIRPLSVLPSDTEGVHRIANTERSDRVADIVFVHGLGGGSHNTWTHGKPGEPGHFFWPKELGRELPECGIWALGYEAGVLPWFGADGMPIEDRAVNLVHKLRTNCLGERPLVFVTHSMGGLMVKEIVVQSLTAGDEGWAKLVKQISGIVFCGTPHRGSHVAKMAKRLAAVLRTQGHIREMAAGERHLNRLHKQFVEWQRATQTPVQAYAERIGMKRHRWWLRWLPALVIVPPESADPEIAGCTCVPCHDDHLSLVKPAAAQHDVYLGVRLFIEECITRPSPPSLPRPLLQATWQYLEAVLPRNP
jgi:pimeloyl-ACP methyl ester carboxylesterase